MYFKTLDLTKFLMCLVDLSMDTISGTIYINTIFSFLPCINEHFTGNVLCSSDNSVMQLIHIFHFFMINSVFYKPPEKIIWRRCREQGCQGMGPFFPSNNQEIPCPERHRHNGRSEVVHSKTGNLFP